VLLRNVLAVVGNELRQPASTAPAADSPESDTPNDLSQKAVDGFLINGTVNNGASSPFSLANAFGNNRRGPRSLYSGGIGLMLDNSVLDARSFSLTGQDTPKPAYTHLQGTVSFGGPIKIPHLIRNGPNFFVGYQWTRNRNAGIQSTLMPTPLERIGDFSQTLNPLGKPVQIFDPNNSGAPFIGNAIPESRLSAQAKALLNEFGVTDGVGHYTGTQTGFDAPANLASWYLRRFSCAASAVCDTAADDALLAARLAARPGDRQAQFANADRILAGITPFIPLTQPVRWSLVSPRLTAFRPNAFARHPAVNLLGEEP